ncbi:MAG: segregation/condensation protein A [Heliobacteriaceae bacterium]|nr:segregation/condensation protein A [Heliobacteriaceae bacterium]MDD4587343.1 segregation/condensation protein A [Heliobacteriaceae bacterium]
MNTYQVKLPVFEGPFDLLFHLIEKNEIDIYDIPIALITEEYLAYLKQMQELDLELASSFLVMAAELLAIKARLLLPGSPVTGSTTGQLPEEDPRLELVDRLVEYRRCKMVSQILKELASEQSLHYSRGLDPTVLAGFLGDKKPLTGIELGDLLAAWRQVCNREGPADPVQAIPREELSVQGRIEELLNLFAGHRTGALLSFKALFTPGAGRGELVVTFIAVLELVRQQKVRLRQAETLGEIFLVPTGGERA